MKKEGIFNISSVAVFCCAGIVLPFLLPSVISNLIKPLAICCYLYIIVKKQEGRLLFTFEHKSIIVLLMLYVIALIRAGGTDGVSSTISYILYLLFAFFSIEIQLTRRQIETFICLIYLSSAAFSIMVALSNPLWSTNIYNRTMLNVLWIRMNSNQIVYVSLIGIALIPYMLDNKKVFKNTLFHLPLILIYIYIVLLTMSRSAFLCLISIICIYILELLSKYKGTKKIAIIISVFTVALASLYIIDNFIPAAQLARLFEKDAYSDSSGRTSMYIEAINAVQNPLWGSGPGTYAGHGKIHNVFIKMYFEIGIVGAIVLALIVLKLLLKSIKNYGKFVFLVLFFQAMLESGDAYTFWVPLILAYYMSIENKESKLCRENSNDSIKG